MGTLTNSSKLIEKIESLEPVEYNAGTGISIGEGQICTEESDRKGPAPSGFHVPTSAEWGGVRTIMDSLSLTTGNGWKINLHMPFAGERGYSDAATSDQNLFGYYWSSSISGANAFFFDLESDEIFDGTSRRADGFSIRCFKNSYEEPDSSWTVIQGTLGNVGIFWNQSQGLISITNGTTGYTMMDKNLGATTVYNNGDTLSEANCGKYYQRGNNYGFAYSGAVTTSSTQVDASSYGPTNPYSSDTFITGSDDRSSVQNNDLWGNTSNSTHQECGGTADNVITNTGVLSVNGQTGDVTISTPDIYYASVYGEMGGHKLGTDTTYEEVKAAYDTGKILSLKYYSTSSMIIYDFDGAYGDTASPQGYMIFYFYSKHDNRYYKIGYSTSGWETLSGNVSSSEVLTKTNTTSFTPSGNYNPATKKYVDDLVGDVESLLAAI